MVKRKRDIVLYEVVKNGDAQPLLVRHTFDASNPDLDALKAWFNQHKPE